MAPRDSRCFRCICFCLVFAFLLFEMPNAASGHVIPRAKFKLISVDNYYPELSQTSHDHSARLAKLPRKPTGAASREPKLVRSWSLSGVSSVSGISVNPAGGNPVIFHRGSNNPVQISSSFDASNHYLGAKDSPIKDDTILELDSETGEIKNRRGRDLFFIPHGLTVDHEGNVWATDLALHQVIKLPPYSDRPSLTLGEAFIPGADLNHFCKPTTTAVSRTGTIFVADGYCNSRVVQFSADGTPIGSFGSEETVPMNTPHSVSLQEELDTLCVADRENSRIICFRAGIKEASDFGEKARILTEPKRDMIFGVAVAKNELVYALAAYRDAKNHYYGGLGMTFDLKENGEPDKWGEREGFNVPHSMALSPDESSLYIAEISPDGMIRKYAVNTELAD